MRQKLLEGDLEALEDAKNRLGCYYAEERSLDDTLSLVEKLYKQELVILLEDIVHGIERDFSHTFYSLVQAVIYKYYAYNLSVYERYVTKMRLRKIGINLR